jgi:hypothetical protein
MPTRRGASPAAFSCLWQTAALAAFLVRPRLGLEGWPHAPPRMRGHPSRIPRLGDSVDLPRGTHPTARHLVVKAALGWGQRSRPSPGRGRNTSRAFIPVPTEGFPIPTAMAISIACIKNDVDVADTTRHVDIRDKRRVRAPGRVGLWSTGLRPPAYRPVTGRPGRFARSPAGPGARRKGIDTPVQCAALAVPALPLPCLKAKRDGFVGSPAFTRGRGTWRGSVDGVQDPRPQEDAALR